MRRLSAILLVLAMLPLADIRVKSGGLEFAEFAGTRSMRRQIRWPKRRITIAFSTSLLSPGPSFKLGSDIVGAARRALSRWAGMADITLVESSSSAQSVSESQGDGISLLTIADTRENNAMFTDAEMTGRTRVFFDPDTGAIAEADICINPHPALSDGTPVQFSTDGTPGTYDLESTITHEIGHLLGLDHSAVIASTMQAHQGLNGVYGLPAFTARTLSEEDRERVRTLYGPRTGDGAIDGTTTPTLAGSRVWAENTVTGRVVAGSVVSSDGTYRIEALVPGQYRVLMEQLSALSTREGSADEISSISGPPVVRATEISSQVTVSANSNSEATPNPLLTQSASQFLRPRLLGINGDLSTVALPLEAGKTFRVYLGGEGVDQLSGSAISISSPFFKVNAASLNREEFKTSFPVVSFEVSVAPNVPFGDYSIKLQSDSGEAAYMAGGITIDPGSTSLMPNPVDDAHFFVSQHYRDFLGREPDRGGLDYWSSQLQQCGSDANCARSKRLAISAAFFGEDEFQAPSAFVYGLYKTLGRRPTFAEFVADRSLIVSSSSNPDGYERALATAFVRRPEFVKKYPTTLTAEQFVDALLAEGLQSSLADSSRATLLALYDKTDEGRASLLERAINSPSFLRAEYNRLFVLMQYFTYLRREPDDAGFNFWMTVLQNKPLTNTNAFKGVSCAFVNSAEYQSRFGMVITHASSECFR